MGKQLYHNEGNYIGWKLWNNIILSLMNFHSIKSDIKNEFCYFTKLRLKSPAKKQLRVSCILTLEVAKADKIGSRVENDIIIGSENFINDIIVVIKVNRLAFSRVKNVFSRHVLIKIWHCICSLKYNFDLNKRLFVFYYSNDGYILEFLKCFSFTRITWKKWYIRHTDRQNKNNMQRSLMQGHKKIKSTFFIK